MLFDNLEKGQDNPAGILNHFINDEEEYKEVAALFHTTLKDISSREEREKALEETVRRVKRHSLDEASRNASDIETLQEIIRKQAELSQLHISLD